MQPLALILVLVSAIIHAGWNMLGQKRQVTPGFFLIVCTAAALALAPMLWIGREFYPLLDAVFWMCVAGSGVFECVYYVALCGAYRSGDLTATYPLLRAVPVVLVALVSLGVGGERAPEGVGLAGVGLVAVGCLVLPLASFRRPKFSAYLQPASLFALMAGSATTGYSLADDQALQSLAEPNATVFFLALKTLSSSLALGVYLLFRSTDRKEFFQKAREDLWPGVLTGVLIFGAYGLVLAAMSLAENVSYVVAFRQLSIPLGATLGFVVNRENPAPTRVAGIGLIVAGLVLVALG
jgi:drug/metabolite transporter (DMT)-like permease